MLKLMNDWTDAEWERLLSDDPHTPGGDVNGHAQPLFLFLSVEHSDRPMDAGESMCAGLPPIEPMTS